ncbi:MAG: maleylpyruvate isomerase family mycothiol-dependent enzyme [Actinomycetota bacterium]|nr:maleylpyruvate isomerase family mycothiol-dependent enzyme [Actinomycetota bacterium]
MSAVLEMMRAAFVGIDDACTGLAGGQWDAPTECPGWSVKDIVSHLCGIEEGLLGKPRPLPVDPWPEHVKNELAARNEADILSRRSRPGQSVLEEFRDLTSQRVKELEQLPAGAWDAESQGVFGRAKLTEIIAIRVVDVYYHEQDIRRAVGRPGHHDGDVPAFVLQRMQKTLPRSLVKVAHAPAGTTLLCDVTTLPGRPFALEVRGDGRAYDVAVPRSPTVTLKTTSDGLLRLLGGRWEVGAAVHDGRVTVHGDTDLARRILRDMAAMP